MKNRNVMIAGTVIVILIVAVVIGIVWAFNQKGNVQDGQPQSAETNEQVNADKTEDEIIIVKT